MINFEKASTYLQCLMYYCKLYTYGIHSQINVFYLIYPVEI